MNGSLALGSYAGNLGTNNLMANNTTLQPQGSGFLDQAGGYINLATGVVSLADMLNNWGVAKDAMKTNMANVRQQMSQSQEAFDRSVARQDRSRAAVEESAAKSLALQGG
ncbi:hypothetical protein vBAmePPT11V19_00026 [Alteromonas phage vB_AmeP_PT11-V19]|nr:hypothetical protein vBAmePPT11V19_00026 [Alteromonas phage vB_AmeP_PT11-V19]